MRFPATSSWVGIGADNVTFFVGSLFFTIAAALQYLEVVNADPSGTRADTGDRVRFLAWEPHRIDWCATAVQLVGTVFFNISTFAALDRHFGAPKADRIVWRPDVFGSICFLVASQLALARGRPPLDLLAARDCARGGSRRSNLAGSIAFGVSAVAAYVVPASGDPRNVELVNLGTFVGALCFLVGAFLLLPERTDPVDTVR